MPQLPELVGPAPGVMLQPGGGPWTQSTNGIRPDEVAWNIDGILNAISLIPGP